MDVRRFYTGIRPTLILFFSVFLATTHLSTARAASAEAGAAAYRSVVARSLECIWTGRPFGASLEADQKQLKAAMRAGRLGSDDLKKMVGEAMSSILERLVTSRYVLPVAAKRFDELFAPHLVWEEAKRTIWEAGLSKAKTSASTLITIGTLAPSGTPWINIPENVTKPRIAMLSRGKILIKIYTGGVMGEDTDILRKMDIGQLDGCGCTALGVLAAAPEISVLIAPRLFRDYGEVDYIYERFRKQIDRAFEKRGYIPVALIDTGFMYIFSKKSVSSLGDIRRCKVITWFGEIEATLDKELGIHPIPVAVPEIISALSSGLADSNISPPAWMLGMQAYQYSSCYLNVPLFYSPAVVLVSTKTRDRLQRFMGLSDNVTDNFLELIVHEFNSDEKEWRRQIREYESKSLEAFRSKAGIREVNLSDAEIAEIDRASNSVRAKLADKLYSKRFLIEIEKALADYRKGTR